MRYIIDNKNPNARKQQIRTMFDSIVEGYDRANRILSLGIDKIWRKKMIHQIDCKSNDVVLDVCCGTGDLSKLIRSTGARVISLDFSSAMIKKGIKNGNIDDMAAVADASRLPFKEATFTRVCVSFGIRNIPDIDIFLGEVFRVLQPGGMFVALEFTRPRNTVVRLLYFLYLYTFLPIIGGIIAGNIKAYRYLSKTIHTFIDPPSLLAIQEKHGFIEIKCNSMTLSIVTAYSSIKPKSLSSPLSLQHLNRLQHNRVIIH
ncbi:MAG TPA: ubiquinone/menaquinone biosynthesis methyltransferase [Spirochaetota bacterium]|nr:ubiquinone/menaquinone biosynthesis methyltransferase [Spirochaetota bacterium]HQL44163.1 ubiquinone/menaquinone biosynthesis methyltransferase [Spirochaetota bacterium]